MHLHNVSSAGRLLGGVAMLAALAIAASACVTPLPAPVQPGPEAATAMPAVTSGTTPAVAVPVEPSTEAPVEAAATAPIEPPGAVAAATVEAPASASATAPAGAGLDETTLKNATYEIEGLGPVQLKDGQYQQQYGQGASEVNTVTFVQAAYGDLNGDQVGDAAVILTVNSGGSGTFYHLIPMLDDNGTPKQAGDSLLGDRVHINTLAITDEQIVVDMLTQGPNDPMCCPTQQVIQTYEVIGNALALVSQSSPAAAPTQAPAAPQPTAPPAPAAPAPAPQPPAATGPGAPQRIQFEPGATSATVQGSLPGRGADRWVVKAAAGQIMSVQLATRGGEAILIIWGADGTVLISDHAGATEWSGTLPSTQDYYIDVRSVSDTATNYALTVTIPPLSGGPESIQRITFAPGATSATVQGQVAGRYTDRWVVKAAAGQTMTVQLTPTRGQAILIIFGADGNVLISDHAGATYFSETLPKTQDYNIDVRGVTDGTNSYTLKVTIPPLSGGTVSTQRLRFQPGATSATVQDHLPANGVDRWLLGARAGQTMLVSLNGNVTLAVTDPSGRVLVPASAGRQYWQGALRVSGDYRVDVVDGGSAQDYAMSVSIK